jgi:hypothetical protein
VVVRLHPDVAGSVDRDVEDLTTEENFDLLAWSEGGQGKTSVIPMRWILHTPSGSRTLTSLTLPSPFIGRSPGGTPPGGGERVRSAMALRSALFAALAVALFADMPG